MKKFNIVILLIFMLVITFYILSIFNISFFGFRIYRIATGSMMPSLKVNDVVITKKTNNYQVGDIITFKENNSYITHRIVSINDENIITKGDSNNIEDDEITKDKVVGKLVYKCKILTLLIKLELPLIILLFICMLVITLLIPDKRKRT